MYLRHRFPIFEKKIYLNSCSQGALSTDVIDAYQTYLQDWREYGSPWDLWVGRQETVRGQLASLLNAHPDEIALTTSSSAAVNALASAITFSGQRNRVVVDEFAFPTTAQIWHAQTARGAQVVHVPASGNHIPLEAFEAAIDERTALVNLTHVCYRNGVKNDVQAVVEIAKRHGALVLLDSFQAVGTMPIDVSKMRADFIVGGMLKYLLGAAGLAFLFARSSASENLIPTHSGWFAQADINAMDIYHNAPAPNARRFEAGTPSVPSLYAAGAGINIVQQLGLETIQTHRHQIAAAIKDGVRQQGFRLITPDDPAEHGAIIAIHAKEVDQLVQTLAQDDIIVSSRDSNLRVSPHFYNNLADVECLLDRLTAHRDLLL
jgi:selenocysteine lyase/cysteine desulfurase